LWQIATVPRYLTADRGTSIVTEIISFDDSDFGSTLEPDKERVLTPRGYDLLPEGTNGLEMALRISSGKAFPVIIRATTSTSIAKNSYPATSVRLYRLNVTDSNLSSLPPAIKTNDGPIPDEDAGVFFPENFVVALQESPLYGTRVSKIGSSISLHTSFIEVEPLFATSMPPVNFEILEQDIDPNIAINIRNIIDLLFFMVYASA